MAVVGARNLLFLFAAMAILLIFWTSSSFTTGSRWTPDMAKTDLLNPLKDVKNAPEVHGPPTMAEESDAKFKAEEEQAIKEKAEKEAAEKERVKAEKEAADNLAKDDKTRPKKPTAADKDTPSKVDPNAAATTTTKSEFNEEKYAFQQDLKLENPKFDTTSLRRYKPHNYRGPGHETFATYFSTRDSSLHDPYFLAAQQLAYRLLWDPRSKSAKHPLTVFVAPFISDEQRDLLQAAGALVKELDLVPWHPAVATYARWRDLFSKLNMWEQTDFSRITFLDLDTFPVENIDAIFDNAKSQKCNPELLPVEDKPAEKEICDYTFTGTEVPGYKEINVGVMVFNPNKAMHTRLMREYVNTEKYDSKMAEQAFLSFAYRTDGPFPAAFVDRTWNGFFPQHDEEGKLKIIHEKLWAQNDHLPWANSMFGDTWKAMRELYESDAFVELRKKDGRREY
ncbi:uncharacterized protein RCC_01564 [Ramularia collo-cygni]|uniref:Glycosyltransferase family 8 protein n=1 Tax=Ramularia collo-cygni TaxID=112498 RepID=A0A2D3USQ3_9PEZI|nr:uncharacterized protein RCC_01564 [Ramularia collo-cygni]CZT15730.1 uncharacterized protein RCC_01564 [Ramularia collo-cygni]